MAAKPSYVTLTSQILRNAKALSLTKTYIFCDEWGYLKLKMLWPVQAQNAFLFICMTILDIFLESQQNNPKD